VASTKPTPSSSRVKNSVPTGEAVADLRRRQEAGELAADLDSARVLLAFIAAAIAPVALPQLVRSITGMDLDSSEFLDHYGDQLGRIVRALRAP
jgi:TetR/AcrR family transcriptional regulator